MVLRGRSRYANHRQKLGVCLRESAESCRRRCRQLEAATYNDLVEYDAIPHVLVLALFPNIEEWLEFNDHDLRLRCRCFLVDMRGWAPTRNPYTRAVPFSERNRLNSSSLMDFVKSSAGGKSNV